MISLNSRSPFSASIFLIFVGISLLATPVRSGRQAGDPNTNQKANFIYRAALGELSAYHVTNDAKQALQAFIEAGVEKHPDVRTEEGEQAVRKLTGAIAKRAREKEIDLKVLQEAEGAVCPLYPFC